MDPQLARAIRGALERNAPRDEVLGLLLRKHDRNLDPDTPIVRITNFDWFLGDVREELLTLSQISAETMGDDLENPLLEVEVQCDGVGSVSLNAMLKRFFASCWSTIVSESESRWSAFGGPSRRKVKVLSTIGKVFGGLCHPSNEAYLIDYCAGCVSYVEDREIKAFRANATCGDVLDPSGHGLFLPLLTLKDSVANEAEVRFVYRWEPSGNPFVDSSVLCNSEQCRHPFDWRAVAQGVVFGPRMRPSEIEEGTSHLREAGIDCEIEESQLISRGG